MPLPKSVVADLRLAACEGKFPFASFDAARRTTSPHKLALLEIYRCPHCAAWHVGNRTGLGRREPYKRGPKRVVVNPEDLEIAA